MFFNSFIHSFCLIINGLDTLACGICDLKKCPLCRPNGLAPKMTKIQACLRQSLTKNDWQPYIKHDDLISVYVNLSYWFCFFHKYNTRLIVYRHAYMLILFLWVYFIISFISVLFIYLLDLFWMCPPRNFTICCTVYDSVCDNNTWFDCDLVFIRFNVQVISLSDLHANIC